ncbi:zinc finger protein ZFP2-like [Paramacrobiotus metropolitanus]|uniref:zinc finger protein ZFP2-like n=1 Tax=Paramacrobiotus metropolitanus TaxID=2943436 RepID=UPI002446176C|nr:zinc finger protein ZFP2-like [Paramacrobiotus metropolitanus]
MKKLDGPALERSIENRLHNFKRLQRSNQLPSLWRPAEFVSLMDELTALKDSKRSDSMSEKIRRVKAVAKINPFQFSSRSERSAAWTAAWRAYLDDAEDDDSPEELTKRVTFTCKDLQRCVLNYLKTFPQALQRYDESTGDLSERKYVEVMRALAQQVGIIYADDTHPMAIHSSVDAIGADQLNVAADTCSSKELKRRQLWNCRFLSYVYRFVCWECSLHFKDENLLKLHNMQHRDKSSEISVSLNCPSCQRSFKQLANLLRHVKDHGVKAAKIIHYIPTADPSILCFASKTAAPMDILGQNHEAHETCFMYRCGMGGCGLRFCTETLCDLHQLSHDVPDDYQGEVVCVACNFQGKDARDLLKHVGRHAAKASDHKLCRLCGKFVEDMIGHVQTNHKEEYLKYEARLTLPCDQCEKRFWNPAHLATHKTCAHESVSCLVCAKPFTSSFQLHAHVEKEHTSGLICVVCQKSYPTYAGLYKHARKHKEVHICRTCGAVFRSKDNLVQHEPIHHSDYSFKCHLCDKTFKRSCNLSQHKMIVHTDKMRKKRQAKREEMRRKGVVSDYKCPRRRMRYEEFPYKCEECRLGWMLLGNLQQHQREKHSTNDATEKTGKNHPVSVSSGNA